MTGPMAAARSWPVASAHPRQAPAASALAPAQPWWPAAARGASGWGGGGRGWATAGLNRGVGGPGREEPDRESAQEAALDQGRGGRQRGVFPPVGERDRERQMPAETGGGLPAGQAVRPSDR